MRIIAGQRRGHKIDGPPRRTDMRPTSDLVRESIFNIIGGLLPGRLAVDLFAGTGAMGLEALSRGAERAIFVEKNRENVGLIHRNIAILRYQDRTQVRLADAYRWARTFQPAEQVPIAVFLDPPYRDYEIRRRQLGQLIGSFAGKLPAGSVIALEGGRELDSEILHELGSWDIRRYGDTQVAIRVLAPPAPGRFWKRGRQAASSCRPRGRKGRMSESQARRDFALDVVMRFAAGRLSGTLGRRLRPRPDPGPDPPTTMWRPMRLPNRSC